MIRYDLVCENKHRFDGWFASSEVFERQRDGGQLCCAICASPSVDRALMTPGLASGENRAPPKPSQAPKTALEKLRAHIEATSDYVGPRFVDEARAMHEGRSTARPIHGEARPEEARALLEEGVPVAPLPFIPTRKTN